MFLMGFLVISLVELADIPSPLTLRNTDVPIVTGKAIQMKDFFKFPKKKKKQNITYFFYFFSRFELQPQLKKDGTPQSARTPNKFAQFVKDNYGKIKTSGMAHKDVMMELSSQFSSLKTK
jgi:hypothetical protein